MKRIHNQRGISLVEMLIAILLVGIAATIYVQSFTPALRTRQTADNSKVAMNAAQQKLEEIRDEARSVGGFYKVTNTSFTVPQLINGAGTVTVDTFISGNSEIKKVTVTVTWGGIEHTNGSVKMQTLISAFG